jgi:hypothetical protein
MVIHTQTDTSPVNQQFDITISMIVSINVFEMKENFVAQFNELMIILNVQAKG